MKRWFESRHEPLLPRRLFARRLGKSALTGGGIVALSLAAGMIGYHVTEDLSWLDAFVSAAMLLSGMGPMESLHTNAGKVFAGVYALYSGITLLLVAGILFAPMVHRILHRFHVEAQDGVADSGPEPKARRRRG